MSSNLWCFLALGVGPVTDIHYQLFCHLTLFVTTRQREDGPTQGEKYLSHKDCDTVAIAENSEEIIF